MYSLPILKKMREQKATNTPISFRMVLAAGGKFKHASNDQMALATGN